MARRVRILSCDFETTTGDRTNVWLWGAYDILSKEFVWGRTIEDFVDYIDEANTRAYFHNLKFDGMFLLDHYLKSGYVWRQDSEDLDKKTVKTVISDKGAWYKVSVKNTHQVEYRDSLKIIPLPVEQIPKAFGLKFEKLSMDYEAHLYGEPNDPTNDDIEYLYHDCAIVGDALEIMIGQRMDRLTTGSNALRWYKDHTPKFDKWFPQLTPEEDADLRRAYRGAWCYANPAYQRQKVGEGRVYDVNSMYAWAMKYNPMPIGKPIVFHGPYKDDPAYPLWIAAIKLDVRLKPGYYPCIQLKNNPRFVETEYISNTDGPTVVYLTNVDYALIKDTYDIISEEWIVGYKFLGNDQVFAEYINYWYDKKEEHTREQNAGLRYIDKQMLVNLYGKFGTNPIKDVKQPYIEDEMVKFKRKEMPKQYDGYVPVAVFITSYCRDKIIRDANRAGDRFAYADTDSLHILGDYDIDIDIDNYRLGAYKHESTFSEAMYYRSKLYIETIDGHLDKKAGGLPAKARGPLNYETLHAGSEFEGKLMPKTVPGGVILQEHTFKIRG